MIAKEDIYWIHALFEGEGCFTMSNSSGSNPRIFLKMTNGDTVARARDMINPKMHISSHIREKGHRRIYVVAFNSHYAVGWMMILYCHPYTSARKKEQIRNILSEWKNANAHNGFSTAKGEKLVRAIARKHMISQSEARNRLYGGKYVTDSDGRTYIGSTGPVTPKEATEPAKSMFNPFAKREEIRS
jgi:hypothetical protein